MCQFDRGFLRIRLPDLLCEPSPRLSNSRGYTLRVKPFGESRRFGVVEVDVQLPLT